MNPYLSIVMALHRATGGQLNGQMPNAPQSAIRNVQQNMQNLQGLQPAKMPNFLLTPQLLALLRANPQQPNMQSPTRSLVHPQNTQPNQQENPYMTFLQQRLGVGRESSTKPQMPTQGPQSGSQPGQRGGIQTPQNVMTSSPYAQNLVIPNQNQIPNSLALNPINQGKGDMIS